MIEFQEVIYYWGVVTFYTEKRGKNFARNSTAIRCVQSFVPICRLLPAPRHAPVPILASFRGGRALRNRGNVHSSHSNTCTTGV
jgi:hypothetical protein